MSHPAADGSSPSAAPDGEFQDPLLQAAKLIEQARAVLATVQAQADETSRVLAEIARIGGTLDAVANRLFDSTFKVTDQATQATPSREALVKIVEELADLTRVSLGATSEARRELRKRNGVHERSATTLRTADEALQDLAATVTRLASRVPRPQPIPVIEIEIREPAIGKPTGRLPLGASSLERAIAGTGFRSPFPKSGGYKN